MILVEQIPDAFSCPDFVGSTVEHHNISHRRTSQWPIGIFLRTCNFLRLNDKSSGDAPLTFVIYSDASVTKYLEHQEWKCKSKERQTQRPLQGNCDKEGNAWLCCLFQPFNRAEKQVDHNNLSLLTSKSPRCIPAHIAFLDVSFVFAPVLWSAPVWHVVAPSCEDVHVFKHCRINAHRAQAGAAIVPTIAAAQANAMPPLDVHIAPKVKGQKHVRALLNDLGVRVVFQICKSLVLILPKHLIPRIIRGALYADLAQVLIDLWVRIVRPNRFSKLEIKEVTLADYLLRVCIAA